MKITHLLKIIKTNEHCVIIVKRIIRVRVLHQHGTLDNLADKLCAGGWVGVQPLQEITEVLAKRVAVDRTLKLLGGARGHLPVLVCDKQSHDQFDVCPWSVHLMQPGENHPGLGVIATEENVSNRAGVVAHGVGVMRVGVCCLIYLFSGAVGD